MSMSMSMVSERANFGLSEFDNTLIANGGASNGGDLKSVEVFDLKNGWRVEPKLELRVTRRHHCSVVTGTWLYIIGGFVDGETIASHSSNTMEAYDMRGGFKMTN